MPGGFEETEATTTQEEHQLRRGGGVVDRGPQTLFDSGRFGLEAHVDVDAEWLRGVALMRVYPDDAVDHQLLDAQHIHAPKAIPFRDFC